MFSILSKILSIFNDEKLQVKDFRVENYSMRKNLRDEILAGWKIEAEKIFAKIKIMVKEIYGVIRTWTGNFAGWTKLWLEIIAGWNFILRKIKGRNIDR